MRLTCSSVALLALAVCATGADAQDSTPEAALPEIVASGTAERPVRADLAVVTVRFHRMGRTPAEAGRNIALKADSVRRALSALGIPRDSIVNGSRWYWWNERVQLIQTHRNIPRQDPQRRAQYGDSTVVDTAFRAHESLQIRVRDVERVGRVIDALLAQEITDFANVAFSATDTEAEQREAIREATARARARAEAIAGAGGGRLGRTLRLSSDGDGGAPRHYEGIFGIVSTAAVQERGGETVVVGPVLRVTATVHGRWELIEVR